MSVSPGTTLQKDPDAKKPVRFNWATFLGSGGALIATSTFTISEGDALLTKDNAVGDGLTYAQVRVTAGTPGQTYKLTNHIITNETPTREDDQSVFIKVAQQ